MLTFDSDDVDSGDLLSFAKAYASLGDAIQCQLHEALEGGEMPTAGAMEYISQRLRGFHEDIDELITNYRR